MIESKPESDIRQKITRREFLTWLTFGGSAVFAGSSLFCSTRIIEIDYTNERAVWIPNTPEEKMKEQLEKINHQREKERYLKRGLLNLGAFGSLAASLISFYIGENIDPNPPQLPFR